MNHFTRILPEICDGRIIFHFALYSHPNTRDRIREFIYDSPILLCDGDQFSNQTLSMEESATFLNAMGNFQVNFDLSLIDGGIPDIVMTNYSMSWAAFRIMNNKLFYMSENGWWEFTPKNDDPMPLFKEDELSLLLSLITNNPNPII